MSEFTSGHLLLMKNVETIKHFIERGDILLKLNNKWCIYLYDGGSYFNEGPDNKVLSISQELPILYFYNAEDHGWGYKIYDKGKCIAKLDINYDILFGDSMELIQKINPKFDIMEDFYSDEGRILFEKVTQQVKESDAYLKKVDNMFKYSNIEQFSLFDIERTTIDNLKNLIKADYYISLEDMHALVEKFKETINIEEMEWISYDYADDLHLDRIY